MALALGESVLIERLDERIGIELFNCVNTLLCPLACKEHESSAHCGNARSIADSLALNFLVAFLVIADIVDVIGLVLAVLLRCSRCLSCRVCGDRGSQDQAEAPLRT